MTQASSHVAAKAHINVAKGAQRPSIPALGNTPNDSAPTIMNSVQNSTSATTAALAIQVRREGLMRKFYALATPACPTPSHVGPPSRPRRLAALNAGLLTSEARLKKRSVRQGRDGDSSASAARSPHDRHLGAACTRRRLLGLNSISTATPISKLDIPPHLAELQFR